MPDGLRLRCEALIVRAGIALDPSKDDPRASWLDELRTRKINIHLDGPLVLIHFLADSCAVLARTLEIECMKARPRQQSASPARVVEPNLHKLKSLRTSVIDQDGLLIEVGPAYEVPPSQGFTIKKILEEIADNVAGFNPVFQFDSKQTAMRSVLRDALWNVDHEIGVLERAQSGISKQLSQGASSKIETKPELSRERRLTSFVSANDTSIAAVCRSANVYKTNMQQWRHEELAEDSVMSQRIEDVLSGKTPLVSRGKKQG